MGGLLGTGGSGEATWAFPPPTQALGSLLGFWVWPLLSGAPSSHVGPRGIGGKEGGEEQERPMGRNPPGPENWGECT